MAGGETRVTGIHTLTLTSLSLFAFAANSLICRAALGAGLIDAGSFTLVRLAAGVMILMPLSRIIRGRALASSSQTRTGPRRGLWGPIVGPAGAWVSAFALLTYALAFSWAYVTLDTGTGALILFGAVQATMIGAGLRAGELPRPLEWIVLVVALGGLV